MSEGLLGAPGHPIGVTVTALHIAPVKGTRLLAVPEVELDERGAAGDRRLFVVDERDRMRNGKQLPQLLTVAARLADGRLRLELPDGSSLEHEVALGDELTARFFSHQLNGRIVLGPFAAALSAVCGTPLRLVHTGSAVDRGAKGPVSLISRGSLRRLAEQAQAATVDARRFRMTIEIDGAEPHAEDSWLGQRLLVGDAVLRFDGHVGRCLVTSRDPESGEVTLPTLDLLRTYRTEVPTTEPLPFGVYGRVLRPGTVRVGDRVAPADQLTPA